MLQDEHSCVNISIIGEFTLTAFKSLRDPSLRDKMVIPVLDVTAMSVPVVSIEYTQITSRIQGRGDDIPFWRGECFLRARSCSVPLIDSFACSKDPRHGWLQLLKAVPIRESA